MQKMLASSPPWPVDDTDAMLRRVASMSSASQAKLTRTFRQRVDELRIARERAAAAAGDVFATDPDYLEYQRTHANASPTDTDRLAGLRQALSFANFKLLRAQARNDPAAFKDATEAIRHISAVVRSDELAAQRLNRELGDTIPRAAAELLARAIAYWLLRSVDHLHALVDRPLALASQSGPLFPEEIRARLDPALLETLVAGPLARAAAAPALAALPRWFIDALRAGHTATLEDGARIFDELYAAPVLPPPKPPEPRATEAPSLPFPTACAA